MGFKAFSDDRSQTEIDELTIENNGDRLALYGSIAITCDQLGLQHAKALLKVLQDSIEYLEKQDLPEKIQNNGDAEELDNPFWQN